MKTIKLINEFRRIAVKSLEFLTLTLLFWLIVPLLLILLIPFYVARFLVATLAKIFHPHWPGLMNVRDVFVSEDMNQNQLNSITTFVFSLHGPPWHSNLEEFKNNFRTTLTLKDYEKFGWYSESWFGFLFWKRSTFDLSNHVRLIDPIGNGIAMLDEDEFYSKFLGPILTAPFRPQQSPWEILIIPQYPLPSNPEVNSGRSRLVFRFHHSLSDGFSFFNLICRHFAGSKDEDIPQCPKGEKLTFLDHLGQFLRTVVMAGYVLSKYFVLHRDWSEWHLPGYKLSGQCHAVTVTSDPIPFGDMRGVSKKFRVSPTAILFSAIAGGLQRFLESTGKNKLSDFVRGHFPWPRHGHPMRGLVNHWTFVTTEFLLNAPNPVFRLREMGDRFEQLKTSAMPRITWAFMPLYTALPTCLLKIFGTNRTSMLTLSSFPGPKKEIKFMDKWTVQDMMFWLPKLRGNPSMQIGILSYNSTFRMTVAVDKNAAVGGRENVKRLTQCIQDELRAIVLFNGDGSLDGL